MYCWKELRPWLTVNEIELIFIKFKLDLNSGLKYQNSKYLINSKLVATKFPLEFQSI